MASSKQTILQHPGYAEFVARYAGDPLGFATHVVGVKPSEDQEALFNSMVEPQAKVSVVSGTGTGKTFSFAIIALWHMLCHPVGYYDGKVEQGSNTYIGAPTVKQVGDGVWKEMSDARLAIANGAYPWLIDYFTIAKTRVTVNGYAEQWFISQVAMKKGEAVGIAGKHRYWQLIILDEAAGIPDEHFDVIDGTQTQGGNRTLMASQGVRNAGRFYESHHNLSIEAGGSWLPLRFSSENSPFVDEKWLRDRLNECGGRNSVEYKIRVRGLFADDSSNNLLSRAEMEIPFARGKIIQDDEPYGLVILSDVAAGEYRDDSIAWVAKIIGTEDHGPDARRVEFVALPIASNDKNEIDLSGDLQNMAANMSLSNATLYVDAGGIGGTVCKLIERGGGTVQRINWGAPCFKKEYQSRFFNLRACAMVRFRDAVRQGRVSITADIDRRTKEKILLQGARLPYHFSEAGGLRYVMMSKDDMRKEGINSPDLIDAMSFAFLEGTTYIAANDGYDQHGGARKTAVSALEAALEAAGV